MVKFYEFEITLADIKPRIWRRFLISGDATFADLHMAIQDGFGWFDEHLWAFQEPGRDGKIIAGIPDVDDDDDDTPDAWKVPLTNFFNVGKGRDQCVYLYGFGDRWHHDVLLKGEVRGTGDFFRQLVAGERVCPPEDCGGVFGYALMIEFLGTGVVPEGEDSEVMADWIGKWWPEDFDLNELQEIFIS